MPLHAVVNSNGRASISSVDPNTNRALIFRDDGGEPVCEECCDCRERCQDFTQGFGCVLVPEGDEVGSIVLAGTSAGAIDGECEDVSVGIGFKNTSLSGNGSQIQTPSGNGFRCGRTNYFPTNPTIYGPGTPPDFCIDCSPCPLPSAPRAIQDGIVHDMQIETRTIGVEPGACSSKDTAVSDNYECFGELAGVDSATIPESQFIVAGFVDLHTQITGGQCRGGCQGESWHLSTFNIQVVFSPVTDRFAGRMFSPVTGDTTVNRGTEVGSINLASVVAIIRGGFVGLRYAASVSSFATWFGATRTRTASVNTTVDFPQWGICCGDGSRREEEVTLVGEGGGGAAFSHDPVFKATSPPPIIVRPRHRRRVKSGCGSCGSSDLVFPTASQVKKVAGSRPE